MLMKSPASPMAAIRLMHALDATAGRLWVGAKQLYRAIKHRHDTAALADQDDYLLADIGLTRDDLRHAVAQPLWRDPTETLRQRAGAGRRMPLFNRFASSEELNRRGLAALDDEDLDNLSELGRQIRRDACQQFARVCFAGLLAGFAALLGATQAIAQSICKPALAITDVHFSAMQPPTLQRKWTATVSVDATRCAENARGTFEIGFSRLKENAPEVDFYERFSWRSPSVTLDVDFWADEAVERYWLGNIAPCPCRG